MKRILACILCLLSIFATACGTNQHPQTTAVEDLQILFINIGDGDSMLVTTGGLHYLIDTGRAESLPKLVQALRSSGVEQLEAVFITHTHSDHVGGLSGLLRLFPVNAVYAADITTNKKNGGNVVDEAAETGGKTVTRLKAGDQLTPDPAQPQLTFNVLGPLTFNEADDNDNSLVLSLSSGAFSCLFAGDMQFAEEQSLMGANKITPCTILKVGNHGNADASSPAFIAAASPGYAVISTDSSVDTDTPAPTVLSELAKVSAKVMVTQDYTTGILMQMQNGQPAFSDFKSALSPEKGSLAVQSLDKENELLVLKNTGDTALSLSGWWIASKRGGEMFFFPQGTAIAPKATLSIASGKDPVPADLIWEEKNVWHDKKTDVVTIYDKNGFEAATLEE